MKGHSRILEEFFKPHSVSFVLKFFESCLKEHEEQLKDNDSTIAFPHGRYYYELVNTTEQEIMNQFTKFLKLKAFI